MENLDPIVFVWIASLLVGVTVFVLALTRYRTFLAWFEGKKKNYLAYYREAFEFLFIRASLNRFAVMHLSMCILIPGLFYYLSGSLFLFLLTAPLVYIAPRFQLNRRKKKRLEQLNLQIMDALGLIANALKAGLTLPRAFDSVAVQMMPPISEEISLMLREYRLGIPLDAALTNMARRIPSTNMEIFISSILISRRSGGDIARVLEKMAEAMKEIFRLEGKINALTSQGRAQGFVLGLLPFFLGVILYFMDKNMILPLITTPQGYVICGIIAIFWMIGIFFIWKIVNVEV